VDNNAHRPQQDGSDRKLTGTTTYNRLVRDRIPEIIESMGNIVVCQELDDEGFAQALLSLATRVCQQFEQSESLEALADLYECVDEWLELRGMSTSDVTRTRDEKRKRSGGYTRRLLLQRVAAGVDVGSVVRKDIQC